MIGCTLHHESHLQAGGTVEYSEDTKLNDIKCQYAKIYKNEDLDGIAHYECAPLTLGSSDLT